VFACNWLLTIDKHWNKWIWWGVGDGDIFIVLLFWKLLAFEFLLGASQILLCSVSAPLVKIVLVPDALQLLMLFVRTLMYLEPKLFVVIFYNGTFLITKILMYLICMYVYYSCCIMVGVITQTKLYCLFVIRCFILSCLC
jgi:hypothetical protein